MENVKALLGQQLWYKWCFSVWLVLFICIFFCLFVFPLSVLAVSSPSLSRFLNSGTRCARGKKRRIVIGSGNEFTALGSKKWGQYCKHSRRRNSSSRLREKSSRGSTLQCTGRAVRQHPLLNSSLEAHKKLLGSLSLCSWTPLQHCRILVILLPSGKWILLLLKSASAFCRTIWEWTRSLNLTQVFKFCVVLEGRKYVPFMYLMDMKKIKGFLEPNTGFVV